MKKSELRQIIKEEIKTILYEVTEVKLPGGNGVAFITKKGFLFLSKKALETTMLNSAQKEYRKVITPEIIKMKWYVDPKEYDKYYWK